MEYRRLGIHGPIIPAIGLGFWSIGGAFGPADAAESGTTIARAIELGATLFDTAPAYGGSEAFLGATLSSAQRAQIFLTTKCGLAPDAATGRLRLDSRPAALRRQLEDSLRRLRCDWVDLLLIHWPDPTVPIAEAVGALDALRQAGLTRYIGVSNFSAAQLGEACRTAPITCNQVGYHLFDRRWEHAMFPAAAELGVAVVAYSPLAHGLLSGSLDRAALHPDDWRAHGDTLASQRLFTAENLPHNIAIAQQMAALIARPGVTLAQAAIAWALAHPQVTSAITGSRRVARLEENAGALDFKLDADLHSRLMRLGDSAHGLDQQIPIWPTADRSTPSQILKPEGLGLRPNPNAVALDWRP